MHTPRLLLVNHSVMSSSLRPRGLQHTRFPCLSPSPGACSNSCSLSQWCHPTSRPLSPLLLLPSVFPSIREDTTKSCTHRDLEKKAQWPHKRLSQTSLWVSTSLRRGCGLTVTCHSIRGRDYSILGAGAHWQKSFWRRFGLRPNYREHSPTHQQKIGLKIYWAWPSPPKLDPVFQTVSHSHREASTSLLSSSIRGRQDENYNHRKLTKMITALSNSMKLWAMVESSDKMWSTGEGNGKPLQHSCLENPMNSKRSNIVCYKVSQGW